MDRVLVTGGAGFIGSHIVEELIQRGYKVAVVDNLSTGKKKNIDIHKVDFFQESILNYDRMKGIFNYFQPNYVIHQAAQVSVSNSIKDMNQDANTNIMGSMNIIQLSNEFNVKKIIVASTAAVYGNPKYLPIDLNHPLNPKSPYGLSKLTMENYLDLNYTLNNLSYVILRYANVYGPRQDNNGEGGVVAIFSDQLNKSEKPTIFGDGNQTRDFVYVKDVAKANIQAMLYGQNEVFNVSTNTQVTINELLKKLIYIYGISATFSPNFTSRRQGDIIKSTLCNQKTLNKLNWKPKVKLSHGLEETVAYYKMNSKNEIL